MNDLKLFLRVLGCGLLQLFHRFVYVDELIDICLLDWLSNRFLSLLRASAHRHGFSFYRNCSKHETL